MSKNNILLNADNSDPEWFTIREAVKIASKITSKRIKDSDIYRHTLYGDILLSIYFQSPVTLRKIKTSKNKMKLHPIENSFYYRICMLDRESFLSGQNLILSTEGEYISPPQRIIDTALTGYEFVLIQRLLAHSLNIPPPVTGANDINYGITVNLSGRTFQIFEKLTWQDRIKKQFTNLPENSSLDIDEHTISRQLTQYSNKECFPAYDLPQDACFVIRYTELDKLINFPIGNKISTSVSPRISTPLSRLFWLACKHNETISPLIKHAYKLLSIFEQWASAEGITDRLSGDTLKTALERGSPTSSSPSK